VVDVELYNDDQKRSLRLSRSHKAAASFLERLIEPKIRPGEAFQSCDGEALSHRPTVFIGSARRGILH
jgi:hypothetical protein